MLHVIVLLQEWYEIITKPQRIIDEIILIGNNENKYLLGEKHDEQLGQQPIKSKKVDRMKISEAWVKFEWWKKRRKDLQMREMINGLSHKLSPV